MARIGRACAASNGGIVGRGLAEADAAILPVACWVCGKILPTAIACCARAWRTRVPTMRRVRFWLVSRIDQGVERGIVEYAPPVLQVAVLDVGIVRLDPFLGHRRRRPAIVGPDLEAVANLFHGAGRDAAAREQNRANAAGHRQRPPHTGTTPRLSLVLPRGSSSQVLLLLGHNARITGTVLVRERGRSLSLQKGPSPFSKAIASAYQAQSI